MHCNISQFDEGLETFSSFKIWMFRDSLGFFSRVFSTVIHQLLRPRKNLVTLGAGVLFLPNVSFYMSPQTSSLGKNLFTLKAEVGLPPCVDSPVSVQVSGVGE